jgi:hypothetical protein
VPNLKPYFRRKLPSMTQDCEEAVLVVVAHCVLCLP